MRIAPTVFNKTIDDLTIADIEFLIQNRIPEGMRMEFKRDHYGRTESDKKEFAADVTAMANAQGGYIFIGVDEDKGFANAAAGVKSDNPDQLILSVTASLRSSIEPEIFGVRIRWLTLRGDTGFLVVEVPKSWSAPHGVVSDKTCKFHLRDENGKHPMSFQEIKRAFSFAGEIENSVRVFRSTRLELLRRNEGPLAIDVELPKLVLHLIPLSSITFPQQIQFDQYETGISPFGATGFNSIHSLDGFVTYSGPEDGSQQVRAFTTLFRTGTVEAICKIYTTSSDDKLIFDLSDIEKSLIGKMEQSLRILKQRGIFNPIYIMVSVLNAKNHAASAKFNRHAALYPYRAQDLLLPELLLDQNNIDLPVANILRPLFNLLWNAFGWSGSVNYDTNGNHTGT